MSSRTSSARSSASIATRSIRARTCRRSSATCPVRARSRSRAPRRLRPRHGHPALPGIRVPDAHRTPAGDRRRDARPTRPRRSARSLRAARVPAARVGTERPSGWGSGRPIRAGAAPAAPPGGLQLSLDFDTVGSRPSESGPRALGRPSRSRTSPTALAATIEDPALIEVHAGDALDEPRGMARRAGRRRRGDRPRRPPAAARDRPLARCAIAGTDGRVVAAEGAEDADRLRHLVEASGVPLVAHEVKPLLVARFAEDLAGPATAGRLRHPDRGLPPQRRAPLTVDRGRRRRAPRPRPAAVEGADAVRSRRDWRPCRPSRPATRSRGRSRRRASTGSSRELELPLIPVLARMEAVGVGRRPRRARGPRSRVRHRDRAPRAGDLRRRRARVHDRLAEAARRGPVRGAEAAEGHARPRPATRPTPRSSRSSSTSIRSSSPSSTGASTRSSARPTSRRCRP